MMALDTVLRYKLAFRVVYLRELPEMLRMGRWSRRLGLEFDGRAGASNVLTYLARLVALVGLLAWPRLPQCPCRGASVVYS